jgi:hypothetical protein
MNALRYAGRHGIAEAQVLASDYLTESAAPDEATDYCANTAWFGKTRQQP